MGGGLQLTRPPTFWLVLDLAKLKGELENGVWLVGGAEPVEPRGAELDHQPAPRVHRVRAPARPDPRLEHHHLPARGGLAR